MVCVTVQSFYAVIINIYFELQNQFICLCKCICWHTNARCLLMCQHWRPHPAIPQSMAETSAVVPRHLDNSANSSTAIQLNSCNSSSGPEIKQLGSCTAVQQRLSLPWARNALPTRSSPLEALELGDLRVKGLEINCSNNHNRWLKLTNADSWPLPAQAGQNDYNFSR